MCAHDSSFGVHKQELGTGGGGGGGVNVFFRLLCKTLFHRSMPEMSIMCINILKFPHFREVSALAPYLRGATGVLL